MTAREALQFLPISALVVTACVVALWLLSRRIHDASIADLWWGPGFAVIVGVCALLRDWQQDNLRFLILLFLICLWALRLGSHLALRNFQHGEDRRYLAMRKEHQNFPTSSLWIVFLFQGGLQLIVALPVYGIANSARELGFFDALGFTLMAAGILMEAVADRQLRKFLLEKDSTTKVMDRGLWAWSRHPNYFGNALLWMGVGIVGHASGLPYWTWCGPALMWICLLRVSGVVLLESTISERRPAYRDYQHRVPAFFPRPPKKSDGR